MPNTLAHLAVHGFATRAVLRGADLKWVFVGCVIPDIPWIIQRVVIFADLGISLYDLRILCLPRRD